jgi:transketolase
VPNSTHADEFKKAYPDRFFEMFIAEQQLLGSAVGLAVLGKRAFASTFVAFFTMASVSNATIHLSGSHAGVSIGEDGPSQMALEDLAMMRAVCDSTVLYLSECYDPIFILASLADQGEAASTPSRKPSGRP